MAIGTRGSGWRLGIDSQRRRAGGSVSVGLLHLFVGGVSLVLACSDDDDQAEGADAVESFVVAFEATIDVECACQQVSSQACASAKQSLRQCLNDAVAVGPLTSQQFPRCAVQETREYNACLRARGSCNEGRIQGVEDCVAAVQASSCEIPASVQSCLSGAGSAPADAPAPGDTPAAPAGVCSDSCVFNGGSVAGDGDCDDGRPGADYDICELGTDCTDCGPP